MPSMFDLRLVQRGARLRRTPFFEATQRYGAQGYTVYNHMLFPTNYASFEAEYEALVSGVTLWDVSVERQVEITGSDAFKFTNWLTPRDLRQCAVGQGRYVVITADDGGIINDPVLIRLGNNHFWLALADSDVLLWAKGVALNSGLAVNITEPDVSPLQLQGPKSKDVVSLLFGDAVLKMPYYHFLESDLDGIPVVVTRTGWTGEVGYEIYLRDGSRGVELWDRIMEVGRPFGIKPTGPSDIRRVEAGILNYGIDMTLENNPYEVGLGWLVDQGDGNDYIGRAALERIRAEGVSRRLAGVEIAGDPIPFNMTRWPVSANGAEVGFVTSALYSPRLEKNIGYAMLPASLAALGAQLSVTIPDIGERAATVVRKPFVDPKKDIPKA